MVYKIFRIWANIAIRVFYGKIEVSGIENIPKDVPLLIASNHPNGFLEPIIMACLFPRPLHFMVRGDMFRKKWLKPILVHTNQIPIFRFKDGFSDLRKNDANLQIAYQALDKEAAIILFIEGGTQNVKTLRPFQKGLARMASSYLEKEDWKKNLHILPVAINFVSPFVLRSRVHLNIGRAFEAKTYFTDEAQKTSQIRVLTDDLYEQILPLAYHVMQQSRQDVLNKTLKLAEGLLPLHFFPIVDYSKSNWYFFKTIATRLNEMDEETFVEFGTQLDEVGKVEADDVKRKNDQPLLNAILSVLLFIPGMIGLLLNIIPGRIAQLLAEKVLGKDGVVFTASIILSSGVGFYVCYYVLIILVLSFFLGWYSLLFLWAWPLGFVYLFWKNAFRSTFLKHKYQLSDRQKEQLISLFSKHNISIPK